MRPRPVREIDPHGLGLLVSLTLAPAWIAHVIRRDTSVSLRPDVLVDRLVARGRADTNRALELEGALGAVLGHPSPSCVPTIAEQSERLRRAQGHGDGRELARLLWIAMRRRGLAWRRFEARVTAIIAHLAVRQLGGASFGLPAVPSSREAPREEQAAK